ncbi:MAG: hypothetical protein ACK5RG_18660 [Cyclobacteriaceae bacterium]|jgi:hypothetical protein|nr:hypothetical protein [Flammeovirgaceae bacterium]
MKPAYIHMAVWALLVLACAQPRPSSTSSEPIASDTTKATARYTWTSLRDSAEWKKNYNFQMFNVRDTLWVFHPDGTWHSIDGVNWRKSALPNAINNLAFLDYIPFQNAIYGLGYFQGNIEQFTYQPKIFRTTNLKTWVVLSEKSNLPARFFYHPFVFQNKLWIIGGEDKTKKYNDIWNSVDGIQWVKQKENLPFGERSGSQVVQLKDKLFLLDNDVWSSTDGLNWQQETTELVKGETIFGYAAVVMDEKIWLLGCNRNGQFSSQVLVSDDGKNWRGEDAPWSPRGGVAAAVYHEKIFMTGGKYGGTPNHPDFRYSNDVWALQKSSP